jgi:hypothetical protein
LQLENKTAVESLPAKSNSMKDSVSRRQFLKRATLAAGAGLTAPWLSIVLVIERLLFGQTA